MFSRWHIANKAFENHWSGPAKKCFLSLSRPKRVEVMCCQTMEVEALVENPVVKGRPHTAGRWPQGSLTVTFASDAACIIHSQTVSMISGTSSSIYPRALNCEWKWMRLRAYVAQRSIFLFYSTHRCIDSAFGAEGCLIPTHPDIASKKSSAVF